jgi:hypothetical protein
MVQKRLRGIICNDLTAPRRGCQFKITRGIIIGGKRASGHAKAADAADSVKMLEQNR